MGTTSIRSIPRRLTIATTIVLLAACGDDLTTTPARDMSALRASPTSKSSIVAQEEARQTKAEGPAPSVGALAESRDGAQAPTPPSQPTVAPPSNMIIRNGTASVLVDSLEMAITRITQMAARLGGFVANTQIQAGNEQVPTATIELKLPSTRFEQAANELAPLGKVEYVTTTAQDVGEEFVDVTARMTNARHLEDRLVELLARGTGKLTDVLAVERELARVREEIERYEGRLRFLTSRVAMSTLTITVHEKAPIVSSNPGENVLATAAKEAWRNFVNFLALLIASLGWLVPLGGIAVAIALVGRRVNRGRTPVVRSIAPKEA